MNNYKRHGLRELISGNTAASIATNVFVFLASGLLSIAISSAVGATAWFSIILGVAVGMLSLCCACIWLDESLFDSPDTMAYVIMTGTLSFIAIMLTYITLNVFPFGDHTVLIVDMHHQYVAFFSLLREKFFAVFSGGSLVYSDSIGLGGNFVSLFAYYLSSPFNLLMLIFPRANLTEAIALATVLKIATAGVTFSLFAKKAFGRNDFSIVLGGLAYSMISFFIGHSWNIMWLDPLILLPLVCLGLELLLRDGKPGLYIITLAMALMSNYYIGYMICIFMVLYYLAIAVSDGSRPSGAQRLKRFWRFAYSSVVGGCISAIVTVPTFLSLMSTSGAEDQFARQLASNFDFFTLFQRMLFSAYPSMRGDNLPNIYCSVLAVFLFILFITCNKFSVRRRVAWAGVVGFLALSMSVNWLNFAWHGFHFPNDLPYRFSFLLSFAMLCIGMQMLSAISSVTPKNVLLAFLSAFALLMIEQRVGDGKSDFIMIYVSLAFFFVYALVIGLYSGGRIRKALCFSLLAVFLFVEVAANSSLVIQQLDANEYFTERKDFVYDYQITADAVSTVEDYGDDMFRMELLPRKTCNDPSLFGYNGMTVFASSNRKSVTTLMGKLGYAVNGVNSYLYKNYTPVSDSLLGVKYLVLQNELGNSHPYLKYTGQSVDSETERRCIHQNTSALSKCYMVRNNVIEWAWQQENPYYVANSFVTQATGMDGQVYETQNINASTDASISFDNYDGENAPESAHTLSHVDGFGCDVTINGSFFTMSAIDGTQNPSFTVSRTVEEAGLYSIYIDCRAATSIYITAGGSYTSTPTEPNTIDLGYCEAGMLVEVTINTDLSSVVGNVFLARLDQAAFDGAIARLREGELQNVDYAEGRIEGTINNANDGLMFTSIPFDSGWRVKVDGERVDTFALGDGFLCFAVPAGEHTISMSFFPSGMIAGIIITVLALLLLLVLMITKLNNAARALLHKISGGRILAPTAAEEHTPEFSGDDRAEEKPSVIPPRDYQAEGFEPVDLSELGDFGSDEGDEDITIAPVRKDDGDTPPDGRFFKREKAKR